MVDLDTAVNPGHVQKKRTEQLVLREKHIEWICIVPPDIITRRDDVWRVRE